VAYASGQYGPRLLSNFMSDRGNQVTLGTFIATFVYSLVVLRTIRSTGESGAGAAAFVPPGDFIHKGSVLLEAWPGERCDEAAAKALREAFAVGSRRTALQDPHFPIDELVQIAARALSPGVNDPFTANSCLDGLGAAMADLARRDLPSRLRADEDDPLRVIAHPATFESFIVWAFGARRCRAPLRILGPHSVSGAPDQRISGAVR
jgi:uncharacterized membrane protein